jgi:hypothetical protein
MRNNLIDIGFYKEQYYHEHIRRNEIDNAIGLPSTLLTFLIGGGLYLFKGSNFLIINCSLIYPNIMFTLFGALFIISLGTTIFYLMKIYANNLMKYLYLPSPTALLKRESELHEFFLSFYQENQMSNPEQEALNISKKQFEEDLVNYYVNFAAKNQSINDIRLLDLYSARRFLILSIILIGIFGVFSII